MFMRINRKKIFLIIVFIIYISIISFMFFYHENWRDEAQAYLICRDMNFFQIIKNVHYEGHPIFYYSILYPLVKLGAGPKIVNILSIIFMSIAVFIILFLSKLNNIQKLCFIVSYPVLFEFSVVGRSYSLIFLLLTLVGLIYQYKDEYPIIYAILLGLLLNTHLLMIGFVGICTLFYIIDMVKDKKYNTKNIIGLIIIGIFGVLLLIQFVPIFIYKDGLNTGTDFSIFEIISYFILSLYYKSLNTSFIKLAISIIFTNLIYMVIYKADKKVFLIILMSYIYISVLLSYIFNAISIYNIALVYSIMLCSLLMIDRKIFDNKHITIYLSILSILSLDYIVLSINNELKYNYSNSIEVSKYINDNIDKNATIICNCDHMCSSIVPYVKNKFYHTNSKKFFTYIVWTRDRDLVPDMNDIYNFIDNSNDDLYYIYTGYNKEDIDIVNSLKKKYLIENIYEIYKYSYTDREYIIYKINKD